MKMEKKQSICCGGFRLDGSNVAHVLESTTVHKIESLKLRQNSVHELKNKGITKITQGKGMKYIDIDIFFGLKIET
jgi:hypothetical protein